MNGQGYRAEKEPPPAQRYSAAGHCFGFSAGGVLLNLDILGHHTAAVLRWGSLPVSPLRSAQDTGFNYIVSYPRSQKAQKTLETILLALVGVKEVPEISSLKDPSLSYCNSWTLSHGRGGT